MKTMLLRCSIFAFGALIALIVAAHHLRRSTAEVYHTFNSPDDRFRVAVYRIPSFFIAAAGGSGDASGYVRLYDLHDGRILEEKDVDMVQNIDQMVWSTTNVHIKLFADWRLPK